ncbi:hypothetical protein BBJ28_00001975 [Nothophytophthora sp. Chile5]|nr:hypothetical protein BBJ28_00001975 [Nothophytophthora sp. Chile5]
MRTMTTQAATKATGFTSHAALRPLAVGLLLLALLFVGITCLGKFQLWMTAAGLFMVAMSVASAVQEFKFPKTVQSYQDFLDKQMDNCDVNMVTLPHLSPVNESMPVVSSHRRTASTSMSQQLKEQQQHATKDTLSSMALNIASPAILSPKVSSIPAASFSSSVQQNPSRRQSEDIGALESAVSSAVISASPRRNSSSAAELSSKLDVLHCGTVIDIQGSHGFIIPHDLCVDGKSRGKPSRSGSSKRTAVANRSAKQQKMPLVIPFNLNEEQTAVRQEIAVGKTVEFAYSEAAGSSDARATMCALNVTPVPSDDGIAKSRSALLSCKQAREVSFARAMEELTMISPRNVPVKHRVDLIKYAEKLDDYDSPFDQFI